MKLRNFCLLWNTPNQKFKTMQFILLWDVFLDSKCNVPELGRQIEENLLFSFFLKNVNVYLKAPLHAHNYYDKN